MYTAGSLALAALEVLVHVDYDLVPPDLVAVPIDVPRGIRLEEIRLATLPPNWRSIPAPEQLQKLGTTWVQRATSVLLRVPSAVILEEHNYLLNPVHPACRRLKIGRPRPFTFDPRLFK